MKALVTGGAGYIGSHLHLKLDSLGYEVHSIDNLSRGNRFNLPSSANLICGDLCERKQVSQLLSKNGPYDVIYHLAAATSVPESVSNPEKYYENNVQATFNLVEGARQTGCSKLVFASTCAVYGNNQTDLEPLNPYAETKLLSERIIDAYVKSGKLAASSVRFYNVAGRSNSYFSFPEHLDMIFPRLVESVSKEKPFKIYGTDYQTRDGTAIRDYIHVDDICDALLTAANNVASDSLQVANAGTKQGYSVKEIVEEFQKKLPQLKVVEGDRRPGDAECIVASPTPDQAWLLSGWQPKHALSDIVEDMVQYYEL